MLYKVRAPGIQGFKYETLDARQAEAKLADVLKRDPSARLLKIPAAR